MRTLCVSVITVALLAGSAIGVAGQDEPASRPPVPSTGCGISEVEAGMDLFRQLTVGDADRNWAMQVPDAHDGETPIPLWIHLHGGMQSEQIAAFRSVDEHGFVAIAPVG